VVSSTAATSLNPAIVITSCSYPYQPGINSIEKTSKQETKESTGQDPQIHNDAHIFVEEVCFGI
jgi:hypothetical protein